MGCGFTSGGQELGSVFMQLCAKYRLVSAVLSPYHSWLKIKEAASCKVKSSLYSCLLITLLPSIWNYTVKTKTICISCHVYTVNYFVCIPITRITNQVDGKLSLVVYNNQPMSSSPVTSWRYLLRFYPAGHETNALRLGRLFPPCNICYS